MIDTMTDFFENIAKSMGLAIKIPRPKRKARAVTAAINGTVGIVLIGSGIITLNKGFIGVGVVALINAVFLRLTGKGQHDLCD